MSLRSVCEAWAADLRSNVAELSSAEVHLYSPQSVEKLKAELGTIHLAVWPEPSPQKIVSLDTGPTDEVTTAYTILVWEPAELDVSRFVDDQDADGAWLDLTERVLGRLRVKANVAAGETSGYTRPAGIGWQLSGSMRVIAVSFTVRAAVSYT
jgi:hypothetical protein